jgi:hypothetical protein
MVSIFIMTSLNEPERVADALPLSAKVGFAGQPNPSNSNPSTPSSAP